MRVRGVYKGATLMAWIAGTINEPDTRNHGRHVAVWRYRDYASQGWKSNYEKRETQWLVVRVGTDKPCVFRFSGKRLAQAEKEWQATVDLILPDPDHKKLEVAS